MYADSNLLIRTVRVILYFTIVIRTVYYCYTSRYSILYYCNTFRTGYKHLINISHHGMLLNSRSSCSQIPFNQETCRKSLTTLTCIM